MPYVLWFAELSCASLTAVTAWTLLVPVAGVVLGVVVLDEGITLTTVVGEAIVLASLALVARAGRSAAPMPARVGDTTDARPELSKERCR